MRTHLTKMVLIGFHSFENVVLTKILTKILFASKECLQLYYNALNYLTKYKILHYKIF